MEYTPTSIYPYTELNTGWSFRPFQYSNSNRRWERCGDSLGNSSFPKRELTILSYNVWFDPANAINRMNSIGKIIEEVNPDLIALQEMTPYLCQLLFCQPWVSSYCVSDYLGTELGKVNDQWRYGNIVLSKVLFHELLLRDFPSEQSRKALWGSVMVDNSQLTLGTFHL